jgi:hypothetical protein
MKAILEFNLPEEQEEHRCALVGTSALLAIEDLLSEIRTKLKHDSGEFKDCDDDTLEKVREFMVQVKQDRELPELW